MTNETSEIIDEGSVG